MLPALNTLSVLVSCEKSVLCATTGSGASSSVGKVSAGWIERSREAMSSPSMISDPWIRSVVCGWAGNTCTGSPTLTGALGLTATCTTNGTFQFVASNVTWATPFTTANRLSAALAEETSVLPSVRMLTVTGAVGALDSCSV